MKITRKSINIPLCRPDINEDDIVAVNKVLLSGNLASGVVCKEFEDRFAAYIGVKYAIACNSCTSALHVSIQSHGITGEVILPSFSFMASANAVISAGATPVFVDINESDRNIDPLEVEKAINKNTEAVMVVHFAGLSVDIVKIKNICDRHNLILIEDSAEAIGATFDKKKTGSFGTGCFSFFPTKNLTTGEGGMITTNSYDLSEKIRGSIAHGIDKRKSKIKSWNRECSISGACNFRMSDINASLGLSQLNRIDKMNSRRVGLARQYDIDLSEISDIILPETPINKDHVFQMYTILLKNRNNRDEVVEELNRRGIGASVHFDPPIHKQMAFESRLSLDKTEKISKSIVSMPIYPSMTYAEVKAVCENLIEVLSRGF